MGGAQGVHEASLPYQRHARLFCPNGNYTAHNWHSLLWITTRKKISKMDGGMRRRDIKGKWRGGTIGLGFQVMLIPLIYLISGWRWALFTSDGPLPEKTGRQGDE